MKMDKFISLIALVCIVFMLVPSFACSSKSQDSPDFYTIWFSDPKAYRTNELEVAQRETPFTIILPTYVPNDIMPYPFIEGPAKSEFQEDLPIRIMYYRKGEDFTPVYIEEYNIPITFQPSDNFTYLNIVGIEVLEETTTMLKDITTFITSYHYAWNNDNIHYDVRLAEYQKEDGRKIVESMIEQLNR